MFVDINLGPDKSERIVIFEGEGPEELAERFAKKHKLSETL